MKRTDLILAGRTQAQTDETIVAAIDKKELPAMEPGAMCYMLSKQGYGGDSVEHWPPHLMFFYSQTDPATWGAGLPDSPVLAMNDPEEHMTYVRDCRATVVRRNGSSQPSPRADKEARQRASCAQAAGEEP